MNGSTVVDGVGAPNSPCREGTGIAATTVNGDVSYQRDAVDDDDNAADYASKTPSDPQNCRAGPADAAPSVTAAGPRQRRRERRPRHEPPCHVLRARHGVQRRVLARPCDPPRSRSSTPATATPPRCSTRRQRLPAGASCTLRVEGDVYNDNDTDDPPDTGLGLHGDVHHDRRSRACGSTTSRAPRTSRRTATRSSPACRASSPRAASTASTSRTRSPTRTSARPRASSSSRAAPCRPAAAVGAAVTVNGRVTEFRQGCTPRARRPTSRPATSARPPTPNLTITELDRATVTAAGTGTIKPTVDRHAAGARSRTR